MQVKEELQAKKIASHEEDAPMSNEAGDDGSLAGATAPKVQSKIEEIQEHLKRQRRDNKN